MPLDTSSNRAILWDHFLDVVCLLMMEAAVFGLIEGIGRVLPGLLQFLRVCHQILIWCAIATVGQFAVCSLVLLTVRNVSEVLGAYRGLGAGRK